MAEQQQQGRDGLAPAQWFVRLVGVGLLGVVAAAVVASLEDIQRYLRIKDM